jgi:hypothetical protein
MNKFDKEEPFNAELVENLFSRMESASVEELDYILKCLMNNEAEAKAKGENWLSLLKRFHETLNKNEWGNTKDDWFNLFSRLLDYWAFNLKHLIKHWSDILKEMIESHPYLIKTMVERWFLMHYLDSKFNSFPIIEFVVSQCGYESVFEYLKAEKEAIFKDSEFLSKGQEVKPTLTWKLESIKRYDIRETEPFKIEKGYWILCFSYFPSQEPSLNINIKMDKNPEGDKNSNNGAKQKKGGIVSILTGVKLKDKNEYSSIRLKSLISNSKASVPLEKVHDSILRETKDLTVDIYLKVKYTHSAILNYINKNFSQCWSNKRIRYLEKDDLKVLLKHQQTYSTDKDSILMAIAQWTYFNGNEDSYEFLWDFDLSTVSVKSLLSIMRDFPNMREDECFRERLYDIGQQSEEVVTGFIKRFWEDLSFYDSVSTPESEAEMMKRPELKTSSSRRYMNSVRYKKKEKEKEIDEIKEESKENDYDSVSLKNVSLCITLDHSQPNKKDRWRNRRY